MVWQKNGTPDTLVSAGDTLTISNLTGKIFNQLLIHTINTGGTNNNQPRINNDSGSNYAGRFSSNGEADGTETSITVFTQSPSTLSADMFVVCYLLSVSTEEKLIISFTMNQGSAGAANTPNRREIVSKWADTSSTFDRFDARNGGAGDFDTDSNLSALATD